MRLSSISQEETARGGTFSNGTRRKAQDQIVGKKVYILRIWVI
jgi:hypothetical protein